MKKWIFILMMLVLPLQASWAAVASYCQHESDVSASHFGHHMHDHHGDHEKSKEKRSTLLSHDDCLHSHGGVVALTMAPLTLAQHLAPPILASVNTDRFASVLPDRPEKPKWLRAA